MSFKQLLTSTSSASWHSDLAKLISCAETPHYPAELEAFLRKIVNFAGIAIELEQDVVMFISLGARSSKAISSTDMQAIVNLLSMLTATVAQQG